MVKQTTVSKTYTKLGSVITCSVSSLFCSFTFAPLSSNALQLFLSLPLLAASIPCKSLSHQGPDWCSSGQGCKVSNWETDCISEGETSVILCMPSLKCLFASTLTNADVFISSAIPTCSDAAYGSNLSLWYFLTYCLLCLIPLGGSYQLI